MSSRKHLFIAIVLFGAIATVGWLVAVRPVHRSTGELEQETRKYLDQASNLAVRQGEIDERTARLDTLRHQIDHELKQIPSMPNVNKVSRRWAFPIDNVTVFDRDYTAGAERPAVPDSDIGFMVAPTTVNITGVFDAIYALIHVAESLPQLVRVTSVTISCDRRRDDGQPIGEATIALEVVYEPPRLEEEG